MIRWPPSPRPPNDARARRAPPAVRLVPRAEQPLPVRRVRRLLERRRAPGRCLRVRGRGAESVARGRAGPRARCAVTVETGLGVALIVVAILAGVRADAESR